MNRTLDNFKLLMVACAILAGTQGTVYSQGNPPPRPPRTPIARPEPATKPAPPAVVSPVDYGPGEGADYERAISVELKSTVSLCVSTGNVKINGTSGDEVRVFIRDGGNLKFNTRLKDPDTGKPAWIDIVGANTETSSSSKGPKGPKGSKDMAAPPAVLDCIWGSDIEIDVPSGVDLRLKGRRISTEIDSVRKAEVRTAGGNISLSNVAEGLEASTYEGSVTVRESRGSIKLDTTTGNIIIFGVNPGEIGDVMRAKTSGGNIFMQLVGHRQVEANSITGGVTYSGKLLNGGLYNFSTSNGSLNLNLPPESSARVNASFGFGHCSVEIPMEDVVQSAEGGLKKLTGVIGGGEATLKLTTTSGSIRLRKSDKK